ncbi:MAG: GspE/PulE family protein [bacterium JZ-2024 1]
MKRLGDLLLEAGVITQEQLTQALQIQKETGKRLGDVLMEQGWVHPDDLVKTLSQQLGVEVIDLFETPVDTSLIAQGLITPDVILRHQVFPVRLEGNTLVLAMVDPLNLMAIDDIRHATGYMVKPAITTPDGLKHAFEQHYGVKHAAQKAVKEFVAERAKKGAELEAIARATRELEVEDAPIVKLVDTLISGAVNMRATDIHLEPKEDGLRVRYRIDGILIPQMNIPKQAQAATIARIKVLAGMDTAEKRKPQDGRIFFPLPDRQIDIRVSGIPTIHGEKMVLRLLDRATALFNLSDLGFHEEELAIWNTLITRPYGIILLTGPTGCGKTTTLYASLTKIASDEVNVVTIEEPVEYEIEKINQVQTNPKVGVTFATALRHFLRQDPDIILVGEIRDYETAEMAVQASLTGHLVFSTLHTNDAPSSLIRLVNIGVEPYLVTTTLLAAVAQRLVRVLCPYCKRPYHPTSAEMEKIRPALRVLGREASDSLLLYQKTGCKFCNGMGYKGRTAIFEIMVMSPTLREMTLAGASHLELKRQAIKEGMRTLYISGIRKALEGITTLEEVFRVVSPEERELEEVEAKAVPVAPKKKAGLLSEAPRKLAPLITY